MCSVKNQQTCTFDNHNKIKGGLVFSFHFLSLIHHRNSNATQASLYKSDQ